MPATAALSGRAASIQVRREHDKQERECGADVDERSHHLASALQIGPNARVRKGCGPDIGERREQPFDAKPEKGGGADNSKEHNHNATIEVYSFFFSFLDFIPLEQQILISKSDTSFVLMEWFLL